MRFSLTLCLDSTYVLLRFNVKYLRLESSNREKTRGKTSLKICITFDICFLQLGDSHVLV